FQKLKSVESDTYQLQIHNGTLDKTSVSSFKNYNHLYFNNYTNINSSDHINDRSEFREHVTGSDESFVQDVTDDSRIGESLYNTSETSVVLVRSDNTSDGVPVWPVKLSTEVSGDLILGGLMMVHEREDTITCGKIMPQGGIQALETMLYTLDVLNREPKMIPNVTIGAHILDDCDKDTYGLEMAVDFIKDFPA
ncbi:hypothetical protein L9F63_005419, partial [Diploptera punctata]